MLPVSEHFELQLIAEGVYAAVEIEGGAAHSNAGIIDLGDRTVVFDTFETLSAAADLRAAAEQLTGRDVGLVINSHAHADHWLGNQAFARETTIITTSKSREQMLVFAKDLSRLSESPNELNGIFHAHEEQLERHRGEGDRHRRAMIELAITKWRHRAEMLPALAPRFPDQTFGQQIEMHGTLRKAEIVTLGGGHSKSDCFVVLPGERVAFLGDLAIFNQHPLMAYGDPRAWMAQLEKIGQRDLEIVVPGHGPPGTTAEIGLQRQYMVMLDEMVRRAREDEDADGAVETLLRRPLPEGYAAWKDPWSLAGKTVFEVNVQFLYERLASG